MADPITYTVSYSFSGFQGTNPDSPLPAVPLDAELQDIAASIGSLASAVGDVRRSDGNLQNGKVTWDALSSDVKAKFDNLDTRVVVGDINPAAFATQTEAEAGVANDRLMTPLGVGYALDALRAWATQAQAQAGTDNASVMTPLRVTEALDTLRKLTTQALAEAGANNTEVMTPLRTAQAITAQRRAHTASVQLTWGAIAASGGSSEQAISVVGAQIDDRVLIGLPASGLDAGLVSDAWVSSADVVTVRFTNVTAAPITPYAGVATDISVSAVGF